MELYTEKTPGLPGPGAIDSASVPIGAEIQEGRNSIMSCKAFSLRRPGKLVSPVLVFFSLTE